MKCKLCGGVKFDLIYKVPAWEIDRCAKCGLARTANGRSANYADYHRDNQYDAEEQLFSNIFSRRYYRVAGLFARPGKLLDIGSSTGTLLEVFRSHGWQVQGVEPSKGAASIARAKGLPTTVGEIEGVNLPKNYFDLITLNHVFEHVADPVAVLSKAIKLLRPGGIIYVDVPNFASLSSLVRGKGWSYLMPWEHAHHFTPETLTKVLEKAGFKQLTWGTSAGLYDLGNPLLFLWQSLVGFKKRFLTQLVSLPWATLVVLLKKGDGLYVIAQKT